MIFSSSRSAEYTDSWNIPGHRENNRYSSLPMHTERNRYSVRIYINRFSISSIPRHYVLLWQLDKYARAFSCTIALTNTATERMLMHAGTSDSQANILTGIGIFVAVISLFNVAKLNLGCEILLDCFSAFSFSVCQSPEYGCNTACSLYFNLCI